MSPPRERTASSAKDLYKILEVSRQASAKEIHRAYRTLARKYHPDLNSGDPAAAAKFREIQEAYEVLGNAAKRKAYDYYGADFGDRVPSRTPDSSQGPAPPRRDWRAAGRAARGTATPGYSHAYRFPASFPRLATRARIGSLTVAAVFLIAAALYWWLPDPGVPEFKRAQEALRHVTSWKEEGRMLGANGPAGDFLDEVSCPSSEHILQHVHPTGADPATEVTFETITIGTDRYTRKDGFEVWARLPTGGLGPVDRCAALARGQDAAAMPQLSHWLYESSAIDKRELRKIGDGSCREWKILTAGGFSHYADYEYVCLGVKDHLPRFQGAPGSAAEVRFYDWNVPIEIVAPPTREAR